MVDLKKLITSFLLLAILVSSFIFIFLGFNSEKEEASGLQVASINNKISGGESKEPLFENLPGPVGEVTDENPELPPIGDPSNFTDNLAQKLTEKMATLDPNEGGLIDEKALQISEEVSVFSSGIESKDLAQELSSFDQEISKIAGDFRIKNSPSVGEVADYQKKISLILAENFSKFSSPTFSDEGLNSSLMSSLELAVDLSLIKTRGLEVPENFSNFHKSLLEYLAYQKKIFDVVADDKDPLKSTLVLQFREQNYYAAATNLENELKKIQDSDQFSVIEGKNLLSSFAAIFSIQKANAIFGIGDISFDPSNLARMIWEWVRKVAVEFLKKRLVNQIVQQTINWIQGGGKPRFVQDFKGFVLDQANKAAGSEIYKHIPQLCSPISPWVKSALYGIGGTGTKVRVDLTDRTRCTLTMAVENVKAFYENFSAGGWSNYLEAIRPQNNVVGSIMILSDLASSKAAEEKKAATTNAQSSQGILATRKCVDKKPHTLDELMGPPGPDPSADAAYILSGAGETPVDVRGAEIDPSKIKGGTFYGCPPDGWEITTPGSTVGSALVKATGGHLDWIVNANDLAALATAFIDTMVNKLINAGVEGIASAVTTRKTPGQEVEELYKSCEQFLEGSQEKQDCINNASEIAEFYESIRMSTSTLSATAVNYMSLFEIVIIEGKKYLNFTSEFVPLVEFVLSTCTSSVTDFVDQNIAYVRYRSTALSSVPVVYREIQEASTSIKWLIDFDVRLSSATSTEAVDLLTRELENKFDPQQIDFLVQGAIERNSTIKDQIYGIHKQLNRALAINQCTPAPPPPPPPFPEVVGD